MAMDTAREKLQHGVEEVKEGLHVSICIWCLWHLTDLIDALNFLILPNSCFFKQSVKETIKSKSEAKEDEMQAAAEVRDIFALLKGFLLMLPILILLSAASFLVCAYV